MLFFFISKRDVDINMVQPVEKREELVSGPVLHIAIQTSKKKKKKRYASWSRGLEQTPLLKINVGK